VGAQSSGLLSPLALEPDQRREQEGQAELADLLPSLAADGR
jgi:hypothetical protein